MTKRENNAKKKKRNSILSRMPVQSCMQSCMKSKPWNVAYQWISDFIGPILA